MPELVTSPFSSMLVQENIPFYISGARGEGGLLETAESTVPPETGLAVI
jgi:hypothetical protein